MRQFDLGDILSITTGRLLSPRHMDGVYDILNYMTGDNLFTHQLPRASDECEEPLLRQHPQLHAVVVPDDLLGKEVAPWLAAQKAIYGATLPVRPLAQGEHEFRDPIAELDQMAGTRPVIVVRLSELDQHPELPPG